MEKVVRVVAGVLKIGNKVLLTSRPTSKSHSGYWEFPGGKIEENESVIDALIRELREEINVEVSSIDCEVLTHRIRHYSGKKMAR
jgi:8-oxo-dGTP diphosphatase